MRWRIPRWSGGLLGFAVLLLVFAIPLAGYARVINVGSAVKNTTDVNFGNVELIASSDKFQIGSIDCIQNPNQHAVMFIFGTTVQECRIAFLYAQEEATTALRVHNDAAIVAHQNTIAVLMNMATALHEPDAQGNGAGLPLRRISEVSTPMKKPTHGLMAIQLNSPSVRSEAFIAKAGPVIKMPAWNGDQLV